MALIPQCRLGPCDSQAELRNGIPGSMAKVAALVVPGGCQIKLGEKAPISL